jgi:hypothetical protein
VFWKEKHFWTIFGKFFEIEGFICLFWSEYLRTNHLHWYFDLKRYKLFLFKFYPVLEFVCTQNSMDLISYITQIFEK